MQNKQNIPLLKGNTEAHIRITNKKCFMSSQRFKISRKILNLKKTWERRRLI